MTRRIRVKQYKKLIEEEWNNKYFNFILDNFDKFNENRCWEKLSESEYITPKIINNSNKLNLNIRWRYDKLSSNPNITIEFIKANLDKNFNWFLLSSNSNIKLSDIENNLDLPWDWSGISKNPNITIEFIKKYKNNSLKWKYLSEHPNISFKDIINNKDLPWESIILNPNLTIEDIDRFSHWNWNWNTISYKKNIPFSYVNNNLHRNWNWYAISNYWKLDIEDVKNNLDLPWHWNGLTHNNSFNLETIYNNSNLPWNWDVIYHYNNIWKDTINIYRIKSKNFTKCSADMTINDLLKEEHINFYEYDSDDPRSINYWYWSTISMKSKIKMDEITKNSHLPWWWSYILENKFTFERDEFILNKYKEHIAAYKIQQRWYKYIDNPNNEICKKKIIANYNKFYPSNLKNRINI